MFNRTFNIGMIVTATCVLLSGCLAGKSMPQQHYLLEAKANQKLCIKKPINSVNVAPMTVLPPFTSQQFIYRLSNTQWQADYYHAFMTSIDQQFIQLTSDSLKASGCWTGVGNVWQPMVNSRFELNGSIKEIYADYRDRQHPAAVLVVDYRLKDIEKNKVIWQHQYQERVGLNEKSTDALVSAWSQEVSKITQQLAIDLKKISTYSPVFTPATKSEKASENSQQNNAHVIPHNLFQQSQTNLG